MKLGRRPIPEDKRLSVAIDVRMPPTMADRVWRESIQARISGAELIRRAITAYFCRSKTPNQEA